MLAVTEAAADAIVGLAVQGGLPDKGGLRVAMPAEGESQERLAVSLAPTPAEGDQVVTADRGAQVFLDPRATAYLSDKVLDVRKDIDGQLNFTLFNQD
jgi:iron-sulfur cluster assembly protein